jgi:3-oxoadipate enol-lactonase
MPLLTLDGVRHFYRLHGLPGRRALVLAHPIGADHGLWDAVVPELERHGLVLRYDLRGHGATDTTPGETSVDGLAQDLLSLTAALGIERFAVCGLSLGGMVALRSALLAPQRVQALVLCSTSAHLPAPPGGWGARIEAARAQGLEPMADGMLERMLSPTFRAAGHPAVGTLRSTFVATPVEGYVASVAVLRDTDLGAQLPGVAVPTLVLTGDQDPLVPATAGETLRAGIPGARHRRLASGHFPPLEVAQTFSAEVVDFLSDAGW